MTKAIRPKKISIVVKSDLSVLHDLSVCTYVPLFTLRLSLNVGCVTEFHVVRMKSLCMERFSHV